MCKKIILVGCDYNTKSHFFYAKKLTTMSSIQTMIK